MQKKGLSTVVATVMLVLLTILAASIIASFIVPYVQQNLEKTECFNYKDYFYFEEENAYNCYKETNQKNLYALTIGARSSIENAESNVAGFKLIFIKEGESVAKEVLDSSPSGENIGEIKMLGGGSTIIIPKVGEVRTYVYTGAPNKDFETVRVYPILKKRKCTEHYDEVKMTYSCDRLNLPLS